VSVCGGHAAPAWAPHVLAPSAIIRFPRPEWFSIAAGATWVAYEEWSTNRNRLAITNKAVSNPVKEKVRDPLCQPYVRHPGLRGLACRA